VPTESSLPSPAPEILEYLARHPDAEDTIDGIQWWFLEAYIRKWAPKIPETVDLLVREGFLETDDSSGDGRVRYRISSQYRTRLEQHRAGSSKS
jgi:hypothetical protein